MHWLGQAGPLLSAISAAEKGVFSKALEKPRGEKTVRKAIESGMSAADTFRKYGIM